MLIAVTGTQGQVVSALRERASSLGIHFAAVGRPALDLLNPDTILPALASVRPDVIVNAAGYTAVDQAEHDSADAFQINVAGANAVAEAAHVLGVPIIHLSTDYVFDGTKASPYNEDDAVCPLNVYGRTKAAGETAVATQTANYAILRTSWVYSPFGKNFIRTILRIAKDREHLDIVADQRGSPTSAFDIADGILTVARNLTARPDEAALRGVFHMTAAGDTTWASFATAAFAISLAAGGPSATVRYVSSAGYPQAAMRPANSCLDCSRIANIHGVRLPDWRRSLKLCVERILRSDEHLRASV